MRLRGINSIEAANAFTPEFLLDYNKRFSVDPANPEDAHRSVYHSPEALKRILSVHTDRTLSKNLEFSLECTLYQITTPDRRGSCLKNSGVKVYTHIDGAGKCYPQKSRWHLKCSLNKPTDVTTWQT